MGYTRRAWRVHVLLKRNLKCPLLVAGRLERDQGCTRSNQVLDQLASCALMGVKTRCLSGVVLNGGGR